MISLCQRNMKDAVSLSQPERLCTAQVHLQVKTLFQVQRKKEKKKKTVKAFTQTHTKQIEINTCKHFRNLQLTPHHCVCCVITVHANHFSDQSPIVA